MPAEVALACALKPGLELDRVRLRRLRTELRRVEALQHAGRLLRHRDLAAGRLADELARRGVAPRERRETLASLGRSGILDDRRLALTRAEALAERGYGNAAIRARLEQAGLTGDLVEEALDRLEPEHPRAQRILDRRGVSPKTFRLLVSRGFGEDTLESVEPVADTG